MRQIARALVIGAAASVLLPAGSPCQTRTQGPAGGNPLRLSSQAIETLVRRVAPSVVQVMVSGFQQREQTVRGGTDVAVRRGKTIGSGVVIGPGGDILTNAHVIEGAERIEVILAPGVLAGEPGPDQRQLEARVIGKDDAIDLALLSIDAHDLPALPLADYTKARQGQLVWAFGSPGGLLNSVSMGVVSAVARRIEPSSPVVWLQTDAAVNPGSSGGPLVNADGEILGLNTFIHSVSGGSKGLGFALPSGIIAQAYPQLRQYGHLHRAILGFTAQLITPALKRGLNLATDAGVIVADLAEGGPADLAGLRVGDVITSFAGETLSAAAATRFCVLLFGLADGQQVVLNVLRGTEAMTTTITATLPVHQCVRASLLDVRATLVERIGIIGAALRQLPGGLRSGMHASASGTAPARPCGTRLAGRTGEREGRTNAEHSELDRDPAD